MDINQTTNPEKPDDITMALKMGPKCFPEIRQLAEGQAMKESRTFMSLLDYIDSRLDCADFRMVSIIRSMYAWPEQLDSGLREKSRESILSFKYWMNEPGDNSMCYWSENHQILFSACEYLAGQLYPGERFSNDGRSGEEKRLRARRRIMDWLEYRFRLGFTEWHSNVYYEEDIPPLTLLIDFAGEEEIRIRSAMILDLMLLDMGMHSWRGLFSAASGRCYEEQKKYPLKQETLDISEKIWGFGNIQDYDCQRISANFTLCRNYSLPPIIRETGRDASEIVIRDSMGLDLKEVPRQIPGASSLERRGMFYWLMEAFTNPQSISMTMKIFRKWRLERNTFLRDFAALNTPLLRLPGVYPLISRLLNPSTNGIAIQRSNTYSWKCPECMMFTHAWFPRAEFDESIVEGRYAFGRLGSLYLTLIGASHLEPRLDGVAEAGGGTDANDSPAGENKLIQRGRDQFWICEISRGGEHKSFREFIDDIRNREISFNGKKLRYASPRGQYRLRYRGGFSINAVTVNTDYPRLDSPYGRIERNPEEISLSHGDHSLYLNFRSLERRYR